MKALHSIVFSFLFIYSHATPPDFLVYYSKDVSVRKGKTVSILKKGDALSKQDIVVMKHKSELVLVCPNYNTIQLKDKGEFPLKNLNQCSASSNSVTASYFHYIWDELLSHHGSPEKDPAHYMRNKGAVSRGCSLVQTSVRVDTIYYSQGSLPIYWKSGYASACVSFYPDEHDPLPSFKQKLIVNQPLNLINLPTVLKEEGDYYWQITDEQGNGCSKNYLRLLPPTEYRQQVDSLLNKVVTTTPAQTALMSGYLLEENHFLAEAFICYNKAKQLEPNNPSITKAYLRFYEIK